MILNVTIANIPIPVTDFSIGFDIKSIGGEINFTIEQLDAYQLAEWLKEKDLIGGTFQVDGNAAIPFLVDNIQLTESVPNYSMSCTGYTLNQRINAADTHTIDTAVNTSPQAIVADLITTYAYQGAITWDDEEFLTGYTLPVGAISGSMLFGEALKLVAEGTGCSIKPGYALGYDMILHRRNGTVGVQTLTLDDTIVQEATINFTPKKPAGGVTVVNPITGYTCTVTLNGGTGSQLEEIQTNLVQNAAHAQRVALPALMDTYANTIITLKWWGDNIGYVAGDRVEYTNRYGSQFFGEIQSIEYSFTKENEVLVLATQADVLIPLPVFAEPPCHAVAYVTQLYGYDKPQRSYGGYPPIKWLAYSEGKNLRIFEDLGQSYWGKTGEVLLGVPGIDPITGLDNKYVADWSGTFIAADGGYVLAHYLPDVYGTLSLFTSVGQYISTVPAFVPAAFVEVTGEPATWDQYAQYPQDILTNRHISIIRLRQVYIGALFGNKYSYALQIYSRPADNFSPYTEETTLDIELDTSNDQLFVKTGMLDNGKVVIMFHGFGYNLRIYDSVALTSYVERPVPPLIFDKTSLRYTSACFARNSNYLVLCKEAKLYTTLTECIDGTTTLNSGNMSSVIEPTTPLFWVVRLSDYKMDEGLYPADLMGVKLHNLSMVGVEFLISVNDCDEVVLCDRHNHDQIYIMACSEGVYT